MSVLKSDCESFSAINDAASAEDSGTVPAGARVREVSCVYRNETMLMFLICCFCFGR
jgi:hypothetical protein